VPKKYFLINSGFVRPSQTLDAVAWMTMEVCAVCLFFITSSFLFQFTSRSDNSMSGARGLGKFLVGGAIIDCVKITPLLNGSQ
jgi:hypothetical protein